MKQIAKYALAAVVALALVALLSPGSLLPARAVAEIKISDKAPGLPVVVELFTSQGCSSCPPAEEILGELAEQPGVLALEMHIDYWDYIGWKDIYATPDITARQRAYADSLGLPYVYTPQMVVDGRKNVVGTRRGEVLDAIEAAADTRKAVPVQVVSEGGDKVVIGAGHAPEDGAAIWLVTFDRQHETEVSRGENAGRTLKNTHVVRDMHQIGTWNGEPLEIPLDLQAAAAEGRDGCAIIVQQGRTGPVLGAAMMFIDS